MADEIDDSKTMDADTEDMHRVKLAVNVEQEDEDGDDDEKENEETPNDEEQNEQEEDDDDDDEQLTTSRLDGEVLLRQVKRGPGSEKPITVIRALENSVKRAPEQIALAKKVGDRWTGYTYSWYFDKIRCTARAFIQIGLQPSGGVAIMGSNSVEWYIAHYAAIMAGGISCAISPSSSTDTCQNIINNAKCEIVVVEKQDQLQKILSIADSLPSVKMVVQYHGKKSTDPSLMSWNDLMTLGNTDKRQFDVELKQRINLLQPNKCCVIVHTSGTTGNPKGVMLSHDNITWTANTIIRTAKFTIDKEIFVSYVPVGGGAFVHQMIDIFVPNFCGGTVYFAPPDALKGSICETLKEVHPTQFFGVPSIWKMMRDVPVKTSKVAKFSRPNEVRIRFGLDRCRQLFVFTPVGCKTLDRFQKLGMPLYELFGISECTGVHSMNLQGGHLAGSVGRELPGVKTNLTLDKNTGQQEIFMSGRHVFMGYLNADQDTKKAVDRDGWLHSGETGRKDDEGFLYVTGRMIKLDSEEGRLTMTAESSNGAVRLRLNDCGPGSEKPLTVIDVLEKTVKRAPELVAVVVKKNERWTGYTYSWYYDRIRCAARAFIQMDLQPSGGVAIMGSNSVESFIAHYAAIMAGGISCGINPASSSEACQYIINSAKCEIVVVDDDEQLQKIIDVIDELPSVKTVVQYGGEPFDTRVMSWDEVMSTGSDEKEKFDSELKQRIASLQPNKCCTIVQKPGNTETPNGVMLSHDNVTWTASKVVKTAGFAIGSEVFVSYLPLSNISAQMFDIFIPVACGGSVFFAQPDALKGSLFDTFREVHPTVFFGVPVIWQKLQAAIEQAVSDGNTFNSQMMDWAKNVGLKSQKASMKGEPKYIGFAAARTLVFSKVRSEYGLDKCKQLYAVGGPIERNTLDMFLGLDMPLLELYGTAECTGVLSLNVPNSCRIGSVGRELPGVQTDIRQDVDTSQLEIFISGRNVFMGYVNVEQETNEAVGQDGWLRSGDSGRKDRDGFLYVTGRISENDSANNLVDGFEVSKPAAKDPEEDSEEDSEVEVEVKVPKTRTIPMAFRDREKTIRKGNELSVNKWIDDDSEDPMLAEEPEVEVKVPKTKTAPKKTMTTTTTAFRDREKTFRYVPKQVPQENKKKVETLKSAHTDSKLPLTTTSLDGEVRLRITDSGPGSEKPMTVIEVLEETRKRVPQNVALVTKTGENWTGYTYSWYYDRIRCAARAFIQLGLQPSTGVAIMGFNSAEWFIAHYAAIMAGGISCGIYTTNSPEACQHVINNAKCEIVVVENDELVDKILAVVDDLPSVKMVVQYSGVPTDSRVMSWNDLMAMGDEDKDTFDVQLKQRINSLQPNKCCVIVHTSGTTGNPKGVMLSHDNLTWAAKSISKSFNFNMDCETIVSYLPLSHTAAQLSDLFIATACGSAVYFAQSDALRGSLFETLKEVHPTQFFGVPRVWEKVQAGLEKKFAEGDGLQTDVIEWAKNIGLKSQKASMRGEPKYIGFATARKLVFSKIRIQCGLEKCRQMYTGAAPIEQKTLELFMSLDMPLYELYGMSECTGVHTANVQGSCRVGSVGRDMAGVKTALMLDKNSGQHEICMSGRHVFMGYVDMEKETSEAVDRGGWLHSGDAGTKTNDGFLYVTGRIKELIITAGGENIPPLIIENQVKEALPCISNCMVIGDRRKFLSMLLTMKTVPKPDTDEPTDALAPPAKEWCRSVGSIASTVSEILETPDDSVLEAIQRGINVANEKATSNAQKIQKWTLLEQDFSVSGGELAPTLKLKRHYVEKIYADTIEAFYQEDESSESKKTIQVDKNASTKRKTGLKTITGE